MKLQANGVASLVHEGAVYTTDSDGIIELPDFLESVARSHGCTTLEKAQGGPMPVSENNDPNFDPPADVATMKRPEITASLRALGVSYQLPKTNDELRTLLRDALARKAQPQPQPAPAAPAPAAPAAPPAPVA